MRDSLMGPEFVIVIAYGLNSCSDIGDKHKTTITADNPI